MADYLASRPVESECDAIRAALEIAGETGCALHVVHVSSGRGVALVAEARARGVDVTAETCPHYLVFTGDDMERLGAVAKCAPPFRDAAERAALIDHVRAGRVDTIGSDHSPSPWTMKTDANFFRVWGGIAGVQHLLPVLLDAKDSTPDLIARLTAANVARRFRFPSKGSLAIGCDADLTLIEMVVGARAYEVTSRVAVLPPSCVTLCRPHAARARAPDAAAAGARCFTMDASRRKRGGRLLTPSPRRPCMTMNKTRNHPHRRERDLRAVRDRQPRREHAARLVELPRGRADLGGARRALLAVSDHAERRRPRRRRDRRQLLVLLRRRRRGHVERRDAVEGRIRVRPARRSLSRRGRGAPRGRRDAARVPQAVRTARRTHAARVLHGTRG